MPLYDVIITTMETQLLIHYNVYAIMEKTEVELFHDYLNAISTSPKNWKNQDN